ncbi:MAG: hypothetical protein WCT36_06165, partial [Candidatus Gracilibacteria bacterium]
ITLIVHDCFDQLIPFFNMIVTKKLWSNKNSNEFFTSATEKRNIDEITKCLKDWIVHMDEALIFQGDGVNAEERLSIISEIICAYISAIDGSTIEDLDRIITIASAARVKNLDSRMHSIMKIARENALRIIQKFDSAQQKEAIRMDNSQQQQQNIVPLVLDRIFSSSSSPSNFSTSSSSSSSSNSSSSSSPSSSESSTSSSSSSSGKAKSNASLESQINGIEEPKIAESSSGSTLGHQAEFQSLDNGFKAQELINRLRYLLSHQEELGAHEEINKIIELLGKAELNKDQIQELKEIIELFLRNEKLKPLDDYNNKAIQFDTTMSTLDPKMLPKGIIQDAKDSRGFLNGIAFGIGAAPASFAAY